MLTPWHVCILIPARNEEKLISRCIRSVLAAAHSLPSNVTFDVLLAVDSSEDSTYRLGKQMVGDQGHVIRVETAVVGVTRKLAALEAIGRYPGHLNSCWLANTDADCDVPTDWLTRQLHHASADVQAVAGIVDVDSYEEHDENVRTRFRETYLIPTDETHPHRHGANMGVRADTYLAAGGWRNLATAEDHDLWDRISSLKVPTVADPMLCVVTSGRRVGRAPNGFADALAAHNRQYSERSYDS